MRRACDDRAVRGCPGEFGRIGAAWSLTDRCTAAIGPTCGAPAGCVLVRHDRRHRRSDDRGETATGTRWICSGGSRERPEDCGSRRRRNRGPGSDQRSIGGWERDRSGSAGPAEGTTRPASSPEGATDAPRSPDPPRAAVLVAVCMRWTSAASGMGAEVASVVNDLTGSARPADGSGSPNPGRLDADRIGESGAELCDATPTTPMVDALPGSDAGTGGAGVPDTDRDTVTGTDAGARDGRDADPGRGNVARSMAGSPCAGGLAPGDADEDTAEAVRGAASAGIGPRSPKVPITGPVPAPGESSGGGDPSDPTALPGSGAIEVVAWVAAGPASAAA